MFSNLTVLVWTQFSHFESPLAVKEALREALGPNNTALLFMPESVADPGHLGLPSIYGGNTVLYPLDKFGDSFNKCLLNAYCVRGTVLNLLRPQNRIFINSLLYSH